MNSATGNQGGKVQPNPTTGEINHKDDATSPFPRRLILTGILVFAVFVAALAIWLIQAPISSAVIAPGIVSVDGNRKKVQHLEGGIVQEIRVRDGSVVRRGEILLTLRDVAQAAGVARLEAQHFEALATAARLVTERDGLNTVNFPTSLTDRVSEPSASSAVRAQTLVFKSRKALHDQGLLVTEQKIEQLNEEKLGLKGQLASVRDQLDLFEDELSDAKGLRKKGLVPKTRLLRLQRDRAELSGKQSELRATIARTNREVLELQLKMTESSASRLAAAVEQLRIQNAKAYELSRRLIETKDILRRTRIRSPIDGTIVNMQVHSRDGVIQAGQTVLEVVPSSDRLVVVARVRPQDREEVHVGLATHVVLTSLSRRDLRPIAGKLQSISADRLVDEQSGQPFYQVRVDLDPASIEQQSVTVLAGMGADVFIQTGERAPFEYLVAPILRTFNRGLREN